MPCAHPRRSCQQPTARLPLCLLAALLLLNAATGPLSPSLLATEILVVPCAPGFDAVESLDQGAFTAGYQAFDENHRKLFSPALAWSFDGRALRLRLPAIPPQAVRLELNLHCARTDAVPFHGHLKITLAAVDLAVLDAAEAARAATALRATTLQREALHAVRATPLPPPALPLAVAAAALAELPTPDDDLEMNLARELLHHPSRAMAAPSPTPETAAVYPWLLQPDFARTQFLRLCDPAGAAFPDLLLFLTLCDPATGKVRTHSCQTDATGAVRFQLHGAETWSIAKIDPALFQNRRGYFLPRTYSSNDPAQPPVTVTLYPLASRPPCTGRLRLEDPSGLELAPAEHVDDYRRYRSCLSLVDSQGFVVADLTPQRAVDEFAFPALPPGRYHLVVEAPGGLVGPTLTAPPLVVDACGVLDTTLPLTATLRLERHVHVRFRLLDAQSQQPCVGVTVLLPVGRFTQELTTGPTGETETCWVPAQCYSLGFATDQTNGSLGVVFLHADGPCTLHLPSLCRLYFKLPPALSANADFPAAIPNLTVVDATGAGLPVRTDPIGNPYVELPVGECFKLTVCPDGRSGEKYPLAIALHSDQLLELPAGLALAAASSADRTSAPLPPREDPDDLDDLDDPDDPDDRGDLRAKDPSAKPSCVMY